MHLAASVGSIACSLLVATAPLAHAAGASPASAGSAYTPLVVPGIASVAQANSNPAIARLTEIVVDRPVEAQAAGALAYRVNGRAGQRLTVDLSAAGNKSVRIIVGDTAHIGGALVHNTTGRARVETITLPADGLYVVSVTDTSFLPGYFRHTITLDNGSAEGGATAAAAAGQGPQAARPGPIILSTGGPPPPSINRPASSRPAPSGSAPGASAGGGAGGPIVLASAPPPPAAIREAPRPAPGAPAARPAAASSREALMQAQVATRREQAAREAEAERQRQYQIAENARIAEENRRAQEAANAAAWSEGLGFLGALVGGVAVGMQTGGSAEGISAGMALGSSLMAPNSEAAAGANTVFEQEHQRAEEQRAFEAQVIAELHNPDNPLTQESRRRDEAREAASQAEQERIDTEYRQRREEADRETLLEQRMNEAEQDRDRQAELQQEEASRESARQEQQRREEAQREREAERRRQEEEERRATAERERAAREADERRQAEVQRYEQEQRRAATARMVADNASGGYSLANGLPPVNAASRGPGSGTQTLSVNHIGGCSATGATVRYSLGGGLGEPIVGGGVSWTGPAGCDLPFGTNAWVKVSWNGSYGWVSLGATPGSANGGFGYNSPGSPNWGELLCGFEGGRTTSCMDADSARRLWTNGTVTEVRIGW